MIQFDSHGREIPWTGGEVRRVNLDMPNPESLAVCENMCVGNDTTVSSFTRYLSTELRIYASKPLVGSF